MLLVGDSMTREVVAVGPDVTAAEALTICRQRWIRHPSVLENGRLVGLISDRDLRAAVPELGDPERAAALGRVHVGDKMDRKVVTAYPLDLIEYTAREMYERKIGCLPVVEGEELVGIITSADVMRALVELIGAHEPSSVVEIEMPERLGSLAEVIGIMRDSDVNIASILTPPEDSTGKAGMILRLATIDPHRIVTALKAAGYTVLWLPERG